MVILHVYNKHLIIFTQIGGTFLGCIVQSLFLDFILINYYVAADEQSHIFWFLNFQEIFFCVQFCFHLNFCNFSDISLNYSIFSMVLAFFLLIAIVSVFCCWYWNPDFCIQLIFPTKFYIGFSAFLPLLRENTIDANNQPYYNSAIFYFLLELTVLFFAGFFAIFFLHFAEKFHFLMLCRDREKRTLNFWQT